MPSGSGRGTAIAILMQASMKVAELGVDGRDRASPTLSIDGLPKAAAGPGEQVSDSPGPQVVAGVVGRVAPEPQRVGLDQHRPRGRADLVDDSRRALAVSPGSPQSIDDALHAVAGGALPELGARGELLLGRRRVRVAVVLDHEDDREREEGGQVHRLVDVAGAGGAVAEERESDRLAAEAPLGIGGPEDRAAHGAQVADHRQRPVGRVAVVDVALARLGRAQCALAKYWFRCSQRWPLQIRCPPKSRWVKETTSVALSARSARGRSSTRCPGRRSRCP
jgi:hypothetical protein